MEEDRKKEVFTEAELKKQMNLEMIEDVIKEMDTRQENIKVYYPYFKICKRLKAESAPFQIDLTGVFIGLLYFLLYFGKLNGKRVEYQDIVEYVQCFIKIVYHKEMEEQEIKKIVNIVLDVSQNNGKNFVYEFYGLKEEKTKEFYIKYIEIRLGEEKKLNYYITSQGIDFYLKTKEFPDAAQITINLLLFRKQIEKGSFHYAYDTVKRLNIEVKRKMEYKDFILENLMYGGKEGIKEYQKYHQSVKEQFDEEEELFGEVSTLVRNLYTEYLAKENTKNLTTKEIQTLEMIKKIEKELAKALNSHTELLKEVIEMTKKCDEIFNMRAKSAFSEKFKFEQEFEKVITKTGDPEKLLYFIQPFLLPKKMKSFNPMKSMESQRITNEIIEEDVKQSKEVYQVETIDEKTQKRVIHNFQFYFEILLSILKNKNPITLKELAEFIKENFGQESLYNGDFISFVLFMNHKKIIEPDKDDIFALFQFKPVKIIPQKEDIDLGNGLKITNIIFSKGENGWK